MARRFAGFMPLSSIVLSATVAVQSALHLSRFQSPSYCSNDSKSSASKNNIIEASSIDDDDEAWEAEKQKCSFCRMFLASPCKLEFKRWSKCVDGAKARDEDFVSACSQFTKALMECASENDQYFAAIREQTQTEDDNESIEDAESSIERPTSNKSQGKSDDDVVGNGQGNS